MLKSNARLGTPGMMSGRAHTCWTDDRSAESATSSCFPLMSSRTSRFEPTIVMLCPKARTAELP